MTNPRAIRDRQHAVTILANLAATRLGPALNHITAQLDVLDGYPTTASGADRGGSRSNDTTSTTERTAIQRLYARTGSSDDRPGLAAELADIEDWLRTAHTALTRLLDLCDKHTPTGIADTDLARLRCIGTGSADGATCTQWAIKAGRCIDCARTHDLSERAHRARKKYADIKTGAA